MITFLFVFSNSGTFDSRLGRTSERRLAFRAEGRKASSMLVVLVLPKALVIAADVLPVLAHGLEQGGVVLADDLRDVEVLGDAGDVGAVLLVGSIAVVLEGPEKEVSAKLWSAALRKGE